MTREREAQHTPGPWRVERGLVCDESGKAICIAGHPNAHLIAAAPELLAACEADRHDMAEMVAMIDDVQEGGEAAAQKLADHLSARMYALDTAIAKARGEARP